MKAYFASALSFLVGYAVCKTIYDDKINKAYDRGWRDCRDDMKLQAQEAKSTDDADEPVVFTKGMSVPTTEESIERTTIEAAKNLINHTGYDQMSKTSGKPKPEQPKGPTTSTEEDLPRIITQQEFFDRGLDKQYQITYYAGDDTLTGQSGQPINKEDRVQAIGKDTLSQFGVDSEDENVVYVRNPFMNKGAGIDFEITRNWGSYEDEVGQPG